MKSSFSEVSKKLKHHKLQDLPIGLYHNFTHRFMKVGTGACSFLFNIAQPEYISKYNDDVELIPLEEGCEVTFIQEKMDL